jgi:CBS domain containing-hemolysin-like protein
MDGWTLWALLGGLLALSASFSGFEAALFSLDDEERGRAPARVRRMLDEPRDLLVTVLLGNLFVNLAYFAIAVRVDWGEGSEAQVLRVLVPLVVILVAGEILPKTLALRAAPPIASLGSIPIGLLVRALGPVTRAFSATLDAISRALGEKGSPERAISSEDLAQVLAVSAQSGLLEQGEADMVAEIVELAGVRVREIMTPRVDALMLDLDEDIDAFLEEAARRRLNWVPVIDEDPDHVIGCVKLRDLYLRGDRGLRQLVMPVKFVPEVADALDLLRDFRADRTAEAVVVDEWGGTAGIVTVEDVFEEIVGELRVEGEQRERPVVPLGEGRFRVAGALSIRDWNDEFGFEVVPTEYETVGGFVTALLGRIPKAGDVARAGELVFEVSEVRGRRVLAVDMHVEQGVSTP